MSAARNGGHKASGSSESSRLKDTSVAGEMTMGSKDDDASGRQTLESMRFQNASPLTESWREIRAAK